MRRVSAMEPVTARKMWRTLEPYHSIVYFAPEAGEGYGKFGFGPLEGYFAARSAPMGAVGPAVVEATFFNFKPELIAAAIPRAWGAAPPADWIAARLEVADRSLRRTLGDAAMSAEVKEAAGLAREAALGCRREGRPLYAGHAGLDWPNEDHLVLWHAITLLREFRGDAHVACLVAEGLDPREALSLHIASGEVPAALIQATRGWSEEEWAESAADLKQKGLLSPDGSLTEAGSSLRQGIEDRTDRLALPPWERLGPDDCDRLRNLVRPWSKTITSGVTLPSGRTG